MKKPNLLSISLEEAFEFGKLEGQKAALKEVQDLSEVEPRFIKSYCAARLKTLN
jgi:hypothetical protein